MVRTNILVILILSSTFIFFSSYSKKNDFTVVIGYYRMYHDFTDKLNDYHLSEYDRRSEKETSTYTPDRFLLKQRETCGNPIGLYLRFKYEINDFLGLISSINFAHTYAKNILKIHQYSHYDVVEKLFENDIKVAHMSLLFGYSLRGNESFSAFGMIGMMNSVYHGTSHDYFIAATPADEIFPEEFRRQKTFAYILGLQFNVYNNYVVDVSFNGTNMGRTDGINIGIGYVF